MKKASEALTKAVDNAEGVIKNELKNPESFTMRAAENRLTGKELTGIGITSAIAGVISSALGVNDDTAWLNGADIPFVGQVAGAAFSEGHAGTEAIKRKSESGTGKETSCEESDKQTSNKEEDYISPYQGSCL